MAKSDVDKLTERIMIDVDEAIGGDYYPSEYATEVAELTRRYIKDTIRKSAGDEIKRIRAAIRREFQDVKSENARLKAELEFYRGIEKAARKSASNGR